MKLGICLPHYGRPIEVPRMLEVARRAEERGLDSVWVTDHVIVPNQANVIYREHMLDPLAVLPWLAGGTRPIAPMPLQKPRPPLYVGGNSEAALRRVARFADGWHATATNRDAFQQSADTLRRFWKDAGRDGEPALSLRIPIVIEGVHQAAVDMALIRGRHVITGTVAKIAEELRGFRALGCGHIALEVSYSTYPAIHDTIDIIAERLRPQVAD